jgi:large subunit ribosomal protein L32
MGPHPKRKLSRRRRGNRRAHDALTVKSLVVCDTCGEYHVAHHVCLKCGTYNGKTVMEVEKED